jgi:hypothetical protein
MYLSSTSIECDLCFLFSTSDGECAEMACVTLGREKNHCFLFDI